METSPNLPAVPDIADFDSRNGVRGAARAMYRYLRESRARLETLFKIIAAELNPLANELSFSSSAPATGAQSTQTITVTGAMPGYPVQVTYDKDLQGLDLTAYVSAPDTVKVVMRNDTGGAVTLAAGKFRVYVWPKAIV